MSLKECLLCGKEFTYGRQHHNYCSKEHSKQYRKENKQAAWSAKYASQSPAFFIRRLLNKRRYLKKEVSLEYLVYLWDKQEGLCAVSRVPMTYQHGEGNLDTNISIDRIEPTLGYVEGNVQLVCRVVNHMKWTNSTERLEWWCNHIIRSLSDPTRNKKMNANIENDMAEIETVEATEATIVPVAIPIAEGVVQDTEYSDDPAGN